MKNVFCILLLSLFVMPLTAQNTKQNLKKYWEYRDRFLGLDGNGGFISVGMEAGQSLPMSGRNRHANCSNDWWLVEAKCKKTKGKGKVQWCDCTVYLGHYIAVLALEYKNLKNAGKNPKATVEELYYALEAYERLDRAGETALNFKDKSVGEVDGWFIRDDVPYDFTDMDRKKRFKGKSHTYNCVESARGCGTKKSNDGSFVSQDQALALLFGFSFVSELVSKERYNKEKETFGEKVALYTDRILDYMIKNNWRLRGPDGEKVSNRWGGDLRAFNSLMAISANRITKSKYRKSYQKGKSKFSGKILGGTFNWAYGLQNERNRHMIFQAVVSSGKWSAKRIAKRTKKSNQEAYALAYSVINKVNLHKKIKKEDIEAMLNTAPKDGPCFGTPGCDAPEGWRSTDRWWHENHKNGNPHGVHMEWPGLDYMLLYNLYHYLWADELPPYKKKG